MGNQKSCIIYAYPSKDSAHGSRFLQEVIKTLEEDNVPYELLNLYELGFNPVLSPQELENYLSPAQGQVLHFQTILKSSNSWIFIYPSWWSSPPAILKGFIDRVFTPGFSHQVENGKVIPLLHGHQALILHTFSYSAAQEQKCGKVGTGFLGNAVLGPCGVPSYEIDVYSIDSLHPSAFEHTLKYVPGAVRRSLTAPTGVPHHLRSIPAPYLPPVKDRGDELKEQREEKEKSLSKDALADLNFFRKARKHARDSVHRRSDRESATRYRFADDDSDFHPSGYTGRRAGQDRSSRHSQHSSSSSRHSKKNRRHPKRR